MKISSLKSISIKIIIFEKVVSVFIDLIEVNTVNDTVIEYFLTN